MPANPQLEISNEAVDWAAVLDRVGGDESLLREITSIFLSEYPALIGEIRAAVHARDARRLEKFAHTLKGSVANFGAPQATKAAFQLEIIGRENHLEDAPAALRALERQFSVLAPALEEIVGSGSKTGRVGLQVDRNRRLTT
jgi:two-component system sensor histidine kinase/response regulator